MILLKIKLYFLSASLFYILQLIIPAVGDLKKLKLNTKVNIIFGFSSLCLTSLLFKINLGLPSAFDLDLGILKHLDLPLLFNFIFSFLILDLFIYLWHLLNHRVPFLWKFHKVHHSDEVLELFSSLRFHPGEIIISHGMRLLVVLIFGLSMQVYLIYELIYTFFNLFEHAYIKLPQKIEQIFSLIFITPAIHRIHHSVLISESNSNYGTIFSFWDKLFKTHTKKVNHKLELGLEELQGSATSFSIIDLFKMPFKN